MPTVRKPKATTKPEEGTEKAKVIPGGYYTGKEEPREIYFREGVRKSKKDPLVATAVDEDNALVLVEQVNMFFRCQCGEAQALVDAYLSDEE